MGDSFESLNIRAERGVLLVQISSPPINLLGSVLVNDLVSLIERLDKGGQDRVVVFSSADPQYFIPHVDVTKIAEYRQAAARLTGEPSLALLFRRLSETKAITIAQIAGRVRGAGSEFALACDMRFASRERAIFDNGHRQTDVATAGHKGCGGSFDGRFDFCASRTTRIRDLAGA
jgi:enoyl-CoA hydratase/carnithine racemase